MTLFLDGLREYLQRGLQYRRSGAATPAVVEPASARLHLIRVLERLEAQGQADQVPRRFAFWQTQNRVVRFEQKMVELLMESMGNEASPEELKTWVEISLARKLGLPDALPSRVRTLELDRLSDIAFGAVFFSASDLDFNLSIYAEEIRATKSDGSTLTLTPIGRVFLDLAGQDAIRWLLHVEAAQSTGPRDPWRVSQETARALVTQTEWEFFQDAAGDDCPHSWVTLRRLRALGLVTIDDPPDEPMIYLTTLPRGKSLLAEIVEKTDSPMSVLAASLLADLTLSAAEAVGRSVASDAASLHASTAAEATARQAKMVAHEIRNALVPVKTAVGALYREVLLEPPGEVVTRRRERIDRGIDSIFRFIDQLAQISALAATAPEPFDVLSVIRDAAVAVEQEMGHGIEKTLPQVLPLVSGHRARAVLAIANVLRNALQAAPSQAPVVRIWAEAVDESSAVKITIDDNGPGVPEAMRQAIFDEGVSLRPGGSGLGLALVKEVFQVEMKGQVGCVGSPEGGARFVIRIPATGVERR